jgi:hypothetical protein
MSDSGAQLEVLAQLPLLRSVYASLGMARALAAAPHLCSASVAQGN